MERAVKERLVGAAVLVAAAVILIPEMLSGPDREPEVTAKSTVTEGGGAIKTYTIDLTESPGQAVNETLETKAPPPEEPAEPAPTETPIPTQADPEPEQRAVAAATDKPARSQGGETKGVVEPRNPEPAKPEPAKAEPKQAAARVAPSPPAPISNGWAVQLGSFSKRETADRLAREFRAQGHDAFVMPVKSRGSTLYRVRIGPMKDRAGAEAVLARVRSKVPGAAVVTHP
ncbi:MAG TPA: SPOR domain-containing protein [Steroidobacter sp.]